MKSAKAHVIILFLIMIQTSSNLFSHASYLIYDDDAPSKELTLEDIARQANSRPITFSSHDVSPLMEGSKRTLYGNEEVEKKRILDKINNRPLTFGSHDVSPLMKGSTSTLNGNRYSDYGSNEYDKNIDLSQYEYSHSAQSSKTLDELRAEHKNADTSSQTTTFVIALLIGMFVLVIVIGVIAASSAATPEKKQTSETDKVNSTSTLSKESTNTNTDFMQIVIAQATLYNKLTDVFDSEIKNALESTQTLDITSRRFVAELVIDNFNTELRAVNYQELGLNKYQSDKILDRINAEMRDKYIINK